MTITPADWLKLLLLGAGALAAVDARAAPRPGECLIEYTDLTTTGGPVTFADTDPVGTSIRVPHAGGAGGHPGLHCQGYDGSRLTQWWGNNSGPPVGGERLVSALVKGAGNVWETGIPGVGIRFQYKNNDVPAYHENRESPAARGTGYVTRHFSNTAFAVMIHDRGSYELVKTGPMPAGTTTRSIAVVSKEMSNIRYRNTAGSEFTLIPAGSFRHTGTYHLDFTVNVTGTTCSFASNTVDFPLGNVDADDMPVVGDGSQWVARSLVSKGCPGVAKVKMNFQGAATGSGNQLFAVAGGATGVGVQLQRVDDALDAVPNSTTPMEWAPRADGGTFDFRARYVRTESAVTPGPANSTITVNLTYE